MRRVKAMRWLPRELRPSRQDWVALPLFVGMVSFVVGILIGTLSQPRQGKNQAHTATPIIREQYYDAGYAKACQEANGVVVVRLPKPNGLECAWAPALQPIGPEAGAR
jgi:hypothetical protein